VTVCEAVGGQIVNVPVFPPVEYEQGGGGPRVEALTEKCACRWSPERVTGVLKPESMAFAQGGDVGLAPGMSIEWRLGSVDYRFRGAGLVSLASTPKH